MTNLTVRYKAPFGGTPTNESEPRDRHESPRPSRAARMLALAHHVEQLIEAGKLSGYSEAAQALGLTRARVTQVMNLLLLAPEIQEQILTVELRASERSLRRVVREPAWEGQSRLVRSS